MAFLLLMLSGVGRAITEAHSFPVGSGGSTSSSSAATAAAVPAPTPTILKKWSDTLEMGPPDSILGIAQNFRNSPAPHKVNLVIGAYRDAHGSPWILPTVAQAETQLWQQQAEHPNTVNKEYLPIEGDPKFIQQAIQFAYGRDIVAQKHIAAVQTLSGTGACRIGGAFLKLAFPATTTSTTPAIYIPVPTWGNHWKIFEHCGLVTQPYRHYDSSTNRLDFAGLCTDLQAAPNGSIILLHACAHNPTGCDPTPEQWQDLAQLLKEKQHIAFLDSAYQGFATGDAEADAWALRFLVSQDIPILLAQSFAKNFGLYGERCGTLSVVCRDPEEQAIVLSQLKGIIRPMYSSPPKHGSSIVKTVLGDEALTAQYYQECQSMAQRIAAMRQRLVTELHQAGSTHDWSHVTSQIGMFAFTGMSAAMVDQLTSEYEIYLTRDGRISLAGLNDKNVETVARAIHAVTDGKSITTTAAN